MQEFLALYMRLSDEDDNMSKGAESNSISHQRQLIMEYVSEHSDLQEYRIIEFVDDGFSGADFSRPNFQKMMDMVKAGNVGVVITKDYSRLGRDYLEVGNYMECIFPLMQVRYISVNDGYDSRQSFGGTGGMDVVLKNIVNAMYCRDASRKVRAAKKVLAQQGKYIAAFAPFGYRKSAKDKHVLEPDPSAAPVVALIFQMAAEGKKYTEICDYLNQNHFDSILEYYEKNHIRRSLVRDIGERLWSPTTVMEILFNEVYIGKVINNKTADNLDTGHKVVKRDTEDWIVVENCHEPLVSEELYRSAVKAIDRRPYQQREKRGKWRKGLIVCAECGKAMNKYSNGKYYWCRIHKQKVARMDLEKNVLECVKTMALAVLQDIEWKKKHSACRDTLSDEVSLLKKSLDKYSRQKFTIYDEYTKGRMSRETMAEKNAEIRKRIGKTQQLIDEKMEEIVRQDMSQTEEDTEILNVLSVLDEFDPDKIRCLIDRVLVHGENEIEIMWNTDDFIVKM